jgi:hypothetical protein
MEPRKITKGDSFTVINTLDTLSFTFLSFFSFPFMSFPFLAFLFNPILSNSYQGKQHRRSAINTVDIISCFLSYPTKGNISLQ